MQAITRLLPIIALIYFVSIFRSACFEISFGKVGYISLLAKLQLFSAGDAAFGRFSEEA